MTFLYYFLNTNSKILILLKQIKYMQTEIPITLLELIRTIAQVESQTDKLKSKIFPTVMNNLDEDKEIIIQLFKMNNQSANQQLNLISIKQIVKLLQNNLSNQIISTEEQKILSKYFGFNCKAQCQIEKFIKKLNPIDITLNYQSQIQSEQSFTNWFVELFKTVINGYYIIKAKIQECTVQFDKIVNYFRTVLVSSYFGVDSLKSFMQQASIYNRVHFIYVRTYIIGDQNQKIQWDMLFKRGKIHVADQILQLSEQYIATQKVIEQKEQLKMEIIKVQDKDEILNQYKNPQSNFPVENVDQFRIKLSEHKKDKLSPQITTQQTQALSQIAKIQQLLSKTKQKYLKNREQIKKDMNSFRKDKLIQIQNIKCKQIQISKQNHRQQQSIQTNKPQRIKPFEPITGNRQIGKIMNRSISKHLVQKYKNSQSNITTYSSKLSQKDKLLCYELNNTTENCSRVNQNMTVKQNDSFIKSQATKKFKYDRLSPTKQRSFSRQYNGYTNFSCNTLSRQRSLHSIHKVYQSKLQIQAQKRHQIIERATSQAKLRIKEIQNRALQRLSQMSYQKENSLRKDSFYSDLRRIKKAQILKSSLGFANNNKLKLRLNNQTDKKLLFHDLLNPRPSLRLSYQRQNERNY